MSYKKATPSCHSCSAKLFEDMCLHLKILTPFMITASTGAVPRMHTRVAGEADVRVWAVGPAKVEMEQSGASSYVTALTVAGTYAVEVTLDGLMLPGVRPLMLHKNGILFGAFQLVSFRSPISISSGSRVILTLLCGCRSFSAGASGVSAWPGSAAAR
jgi:hypothetical protein